jgi:hypothetical protein
MKKLSTIKFIIFIFCFIYCKIDINAQQDNIQCSKYKYMFNLKQLDNYNNNDNIIFFTHDLSFTLGDIHLDTLNLYNKIFLDSLSNMISRKEIDSVIVAVHLSQKFSSNSSKSFDQMYIDIINYMKNHGLKEKIHIEGKNYLDSQPLIDCEQIKDICSQRKCFEFEFMVNKRVEFYLIFKKN